MWQGWKEMFDAQVQEPSALMVYVLLKCVVLALLLVFFSGGGQNVVYVGF